MRRVTGRVPTTKLTRRTAYVDLELYNLFKRSAGSSVSLGIAAALMSFLALPKSARDDIIRIAGTERASKAIALAAQILRDAAIDDALLAWAKALPKARKVQIVKQVSASRKDAVK